MISNTDRVKRGCLSWIICAAILFGLIFVYYETTPESFDAAMMGALFYSGFALLFSTVLAFVLAISPMGVMESLLAIIAGGITINLIIWTADYVTKTTKYFMIYGYNAPAEDLLYRIFLSFLTMIPAWILGYLFSKWAINRNRDDRLFAFLGGALGGCIVGIIFVILLY